jgi:diguanylate cyclase (GGDEF)-like protein
MYACGSLIVCRWRLTAALVAVTAIATAGFSAAADPGLERHELATVAFYLSTAAILSVAAQAYRQHVGWQQFLTRAALEEERRRNQALVEELDQLSREDPLTAVGNRRAWEERLVGEFLRTRRSGRPMSVIVADVDNFKAVNDSHGHVVGDEVLQAGAALFVDRLRATDFVARLGGDEFAILCPDTPLAVASDLAGELADRARSLTFPAGVALRFSFGVAELQGGDTDVSDLMRRADLALYEAKKSRDTVRWSVTPQGSSAT